MFLDKTVALGEKTYLFCDIRYVCILQKNLKTYIRWFQQIDQFYRGIYSLRGKISTSIGVGFHYPEAFLINYFETTMMFSCFLPLPSKQRLFSMGCSGGKTYFINQTLFQKISQKQISLKV